jgi:L-amino acid N-acyltransferase YncA
MKNLIIRDSTEADLRMIQPIYAHEVLHGLATFEETPPSAEELATRRRSFLELGLPYLVAECDGVIIGYTYANNHRPRPAYRHSIENSVYVDNNYLRRGIGKSLLHALINRCERGWWRQMVAVIGNTDNASSIGLHKSFGFQHVGVLDSVGFKLGQWVDTVLMQRPLNDGGKTLPDERVGR